MEIVPLLKKNFLTKNLNDSEIEKLAGAMKPIKFLKSRRFIGRETAYTVEEFVSLFVLNFYSGGHGYVTKLE